MSAEESTDVRAITPGSSGIRLTDREDQAARLLSLGYSHKEIARHMGIETGGVSAHISKIASRIPGKAKSSLRVFAWYREYRS